MSERKTSTPHISPATVERKAEAVFESRQIAQKWLDRSITALGGEVPRTLLKNPEGCRRVYQLLTKIEFGDFS
jgi:uncharacterized protein (DUF2384 family)